MMASPVSRRVAHGRPRTGFGRLRRDESVLFGKHAQAAATHSSRHELRYQRVTPQRLAQQIDAHLLNLGLVRWHLAAIEQPLRPLLARANATDILADGLSMLAVSKFE